MTVVTALVRSEYVIEYRPVRGGRWLLWSTVTKEHVVASLAEARAEGRDYEFRVTERTIVVRDVDGEELAALGITVPE